MIKTIDAAWARPLAIAALVGCGAAQPTPTTPSEPAPATGLSPEALADALVARFELAHCEADHCYDPFPLWAVTGMAVSGDRIALAGPGALLSLYEDGEWVTLVPPAEASDPDLARIAVHDVAFSPDGEALVAVGGRGRIWDVTRAGMIERARIGIEGEDTDVFAATLSGAIVVSPDELWAIEAEGRVFRVRGELVDAHEVRMAIDHLLPVPGRSLEEALVVSGPFGSVMVEDVFGEARTTEHIDEAQYENLGEYSGCGDVGGFGERAEEVASVAEAFMEEDPDLEPGIAYARAEAEVAPMTFDPPPGGVTIPRSGLPVAGLPEALEATERGRPIARIVSIPNQDLPVHLARHDAAVALGWTWWGPVAVVWARLSDGLVHVTGRDVGEIGVLDVGASSVVVVMRNGRLAVVRHGDTTLAPALPAAVLVGARLVHRIDDGHALVVTDAGIVLVDLATLTAGEVLTVPGTLRALIGEGARVYGVGDDGLVVRIAGAAIERIESGTSADLQAAVIEGDGLAVAGAVGTIVRLSDGAPRTLPRITGEAIEALVIADGVLYAETEHGTVLAERADALSARATDRMAANGARSRSALAGVLRPDAGLARETRVTPLGLALDSPEAIAPFGALRERYHPGSDRFPAGDGPIAAVMRTEGLYEQVFHYDGEAGYCCDPDYPMPDGERLRSMVGPDTSCEDWDCAWLATIDLRHLLVSLARGTEIEIQPLPGACPGHRVIERRIGGREVSRHDIACDGDPGARDEALLAHLATLSPDAWWERASDFSIPARSTGDDVVGFVARESSGRIEAVMSSEHNRRATVLARLPPGTAPGPLVLHVVSGRRGVGRFVALSGPDTWWSGPMPEVLGGAPEETASDDCPLAIADADGETTLRVGPTSRSASLTTLPNGTEITVERREGRWIAISAPSRGWVFERNVACR